MKYLLISVLCRETQFRMKHEKECFIVIMNIMEFEEAELTCLIMGNGEYILIDGGYIMLVVSI